MKTAKTLAAVLIASAMALPAQAELSGNVGATSNYLWRGVTQTDDGAAVSGGLDYAHDSGFYAGTWVSNIDFGGEDYDFDASYEWDLYGGFAFELGDFGFDLGYIYYAYPDAEVEGDIDFGEVYGSVGWEWLSLYVSYGTNSDDEAELFEDALYIEGSVSFEIANDLSLGFTVANYDFDLSGAEDYVHYNASLTKTTELGDIGFMVSDTDIDDDDPIILVSWGYEFSI